MLSLENRITVNSLGGSPLSLNSIFTNRNGIAAWSGDNSTVVTTTTTLLDYGGNHNLVNPASSNQPTKNTSDANFNGHDSFTYATNDYNYKAVTDWRLSDTSGVIPFTIYTGSDVTTFSSILGTSAEADNNHKISLAVHNSQLRVIIKIGTGAGQNFDFNATTTTLLVNTTYTGVLWSNGSTWKVYINGVSQTLSFTAGTNLGKWFDFVTGRVNIAIGGLIQSTPQYYDGKWAYLGVYPYTTDADAIAIGTDLITLLHT